MFVQPYIPSNVSNKPSLPLSPNSLQKNGFNCGYNFKDDGSSNTATATPTSAKIQQQQLQQAPKSSSNSNKRQNPAATTQKMASSSKQQCPKMASNFSQQQLECPQLNLKEHTFLGFCKAIFYAFFK